jgi:hypothetical protein
MHRPLRGPVYGVAASVLCLACGDGEYDAKTPGEPIGRFAMSGALQRDECQAPVLGVVDPWNFELRLSRLVSDLYWLNGREAISGELSSNERSFTFDTRVDIVLSRPRGSRPGCTVTRRDTADGSLRPNANTATEIEAELSFAYDVRDGSDCSDIVGVSGGFARLPCRVAFELTGDRIADPGE